jgi:hypothetical protein
MKLRWLPKIFITHLDVRAAEASAKKEQIERQRLAVLLASEQARMRRLEVARSRHRKLIIVLSFSLLAIILGWLAIPFRQGTNLVNTEVKRPILQNAQPLGCCEWVVAYEGEDGTKVAAHWRTKPECSRPCISAPIKESSGLESRTSITPTPWIYTGPRGGRYHYSKNGMKVYEHKSR